MTKKDILELKRRLKKNECTFTRMSGCYVDAHKETILRFSQNFLNLEEEEFYKYLEIAKKVLSGTVGNNLLELEFPMEEEAPGGKQQFLMGLRDSKLKNDELLDRLYQLIIDTYQYVGNMLILVFHDAYDVIVKTNDNMKLDESEEVYEYLLCAICPVELTKPGLGYREEENRIGARIQDWVVGVPENGFVFPAFTDRSTDIHSVMYYTKNAKDSHPEFMELALGCESRPTATEQKETFKEIITKAAAGDEEKEEALFFEIQSSLQSMIEVEEELPDTEKEPIVLTCDSMTELMTEIEIPEEITKKIADSFEEEFGKLPPVADHLIDAKAITVGEQKKKERELVKEVEQLKTQIKEQHIMDTTSCDIFLKVTPEKAEEIKSEVIDGKKYIMIPLEENELANVNGNPL